MEIVSLQELLTDIFKNIQQGKLDKEVIGFHDYKSQYLYRQPSVIVEVKFTDGQSAEIDITEYFKGVVK